MEHAIPNSQRADLGEKAVKKAMEARDAVFVLQQEKLDTAEQELEELRRIQAESIKAVEDKYTAVLCYIHSIAEVSLQRKKKKT